MGAITFWCINYPDQRDICFRHVKRMQLVGLLFALLMILLPAGGTSLSRVHDHGHYCHDATTLQLNEVPSKRRQVDHTAVMPSCCHACVQACMGVAVGGSCLSGSGVSVAWCLPTPDWVQPAKTLSLLFVAYTIRICEGNRMST